MDGALKKKNNNSLEASPKSPELQTQASPAPLGAC